MWKSTLPPKPTFFAIALTAGLSVAKENGLTIAETAMPPSRPPFSSRSVFAPRVAAV